MLCPCREKNESSVLYYTNHKSNELDIKLDIRCTSETHDKPTLYKCNKCKLIFSEYIKSDFEERYTIVEDQKYIQQIPFKKKYFRICLFFVEFSDLSMFCRIFRFVHLFFQVFFH